MRGKQKDVKAEQLQQQIQKFQVPYPEEEKINQTIQDLRQYIPIDSRIK